MVAISNYSQFKTSNTFSTEVTEWCVLVPEQLTHIQLVKKLPTVLIKTKHLTVQ
jgi:hypothetical protein